MILIDFNSFYGNLLFNTFFNSIKIQLIKTTTQLYYKNN